MSNHHPTHSKDGLGGCLIWLLFMFFFVIWEIIKKKLAIQIPDMRLLIGEPGLITITLVGTWVIYRLTGWNAIKRSNITFHQFCWLMAGLIIGLLGRFFSYSILLLQGWVQLRSPDYSALIYAFSGSLQSGICEELAFRGGLLLALQAWIGKHCGERIGYITALVGTSIVFALFHTNPTANILMALIASIIFIWTLSLGKTLLFPIGLHFMWNFAEGLGDPLISQTGAFHETSFFVVRELSNLTVSAICLLLVIWWQARHTRASDKQTHYARQRNSDD